MIISLIIFDYLFILVEKYYEKILIKYYLYYVTNLEIIIIIIFF